MPTITRQIIKDVIKEKVDTVINQLTDLAGQFKKFDIEKLETAVFGSAAA